MAALTDLSDILNRLTGGNSGAPERWAFWVDNRIQSAAAAATVAGRMTSLWRYNKTNGANGAIPPTTAASPTRTTIGAIGQLNPAGSAQKWLLGLDAIMTVGGVLILYDRLLHISGLSGTVTTAQTVGGSWTRYNGSAAERRGTQIWVEIYTAIGTTATTITASYTNENGTSGRTTRAVAIGGTGLNEAERIIPLTLQDGDFGVNAVASVTLAASTGTAGNFGVTVARPLAAVGVGGAGDVGVRDFLSGLPPVFETLTDACLALAWLPAGTTAPQGFVFLGWVEK